MSNVLKNLDWSRLTDMLLSVIPVLICVTVHEYCHGLAALKLGDTTARDEGRLSLNPLKHVDMIGLVMMAAFGFGWARPVPVDMRNFKNPKRGMMITAFMGPASNVVLAIVFLFVYGILARVLPDGQARYYIIFTISRTAYISAAFAVFNVIPIPPLDGSKVVFSLLSDDMYYKLMRYERYGMLILIAIILTGVLDTPLSLAVNFVFNNLAFAAEAGFWLADKIF